MLILETKIRQRQIEKKYMKNDYYKRKKLLNHLTNHDDKLQNIFLNKY